MKWEKKVKMEADRLRVKSGLRPLVAVCVCVCVCVHAQSCLTLCDPVDCSLPGSSVCGIFQARILERVAISYSRGSSLPVSPTSPALARDADDFPLSHLGSPFSCVALGKLFNLPEC